VSNTKFDIAKTVQYWFEGAEYDLGVADALYQARKYPYALFMGHLALEKILKALFVQTTHNHAPHTHSLVLLASKQKVEIPTRMVKQLARFMEFYFEARYPENQKKFYKKCTASFTSEKLTEVKEVFAWLRKKL